MMTKKVDRHELPMVLRSIDLMRALGFTKLSPSYYRVIHQKGFPQPKPLVEGGRPVWSQKEVQEWIDKRFASRDAELSQMPASDSTAAAS